LVVLALPVWAQHGGGHSGGGAGGHSSAGSFGSVHSSGGSFHSSGSSFSGYSHSGSLHSLGAYRGVGSAHGTNFRLRGRGPYRNDRGYYGRRYYPYGYYYPYLWDYGYDGLDDSAGYQDGNQTQDVYANAAPQVPYREDSGLQRDVQNLSGKIDRLQADVEARNRPKSEEPETALVFQDKHVEEVRNYAISGGTLWVLNDKAAKKIPLAQLDIPATEKMNDDRGVDFQVPR
jgi:hypothetical protein